MTDEEIINVNECRAMMYGEGLAEEDAYWHDVEGLEANVHEQLAMNVLQAHGGGSDMIKRLVQIFNEAVAHICFCYQYAMCPVMDTDGEGGIIFWQEHTKWRWQNINVIEVFRKEDESDLDYFASAVTQICNAYDCWTEDWDKKEFLELKHWLCSMDVAITYYARDIREESKE